MCGRYTIRRPERLIDVFCIKKLEAVLGRPRFNIAPTQNVPVLLLREGRRVLANVRWGLVPSWAEEPSIGNRLINARAETVAAKPAFRSAFAKRRCLIPADGFYEWQKVGGGKQPMYVQVDRGEPFAFAGLYEVWHPDGDDELVSCTIITTTPNKLMRPIHDRMPVILPEEQYDRWLDPDRADKVQLQKMLTPFDATRMDAYPVSKHVNSPGNDDAKCVELVRA
jgi:putative SOS response-associated peptidase YedK